MNIELKRIYDSPSEDDGNRVLVDRVWPRGISKEEAKLDGWWKELAPSDELRKWFSHDESKWNGFKKKYRLELDSKKDEAEKLLDKLDLRKRLTLLYGAKDEEHNQAVVLKGFIRKLS